MPYEKTIDVMADGKIIRVKEGDLKLISEKLKDIPEIKYVSLRDLLKECKNKRRGL